MRSLELQQSNMAYLFRQQFKISDLAAPRQRNYSVIVVEPDLYLAKLHELHLTGAGFEVHHCHSPELLSQYLAEVPASVLLLNPEIYGDFKRAVDGIRVINKKFPHIHLVTIAYNLESANLKELMSSGISSHINRKLSRPRDVADIIKSLII